MGEKMQGTYANRDLPACNWLAQWAEENPEVVAGTRSVVEIVVAEATEDFVDSGLLWGTELPQELQPRPVQVVSMAAQAGYLVSHPGSTGSWRDALLGCRALILPDQAVLASTDADIIRRFVRQGGVVIAFSHATLLEPASPDLGGSPPAEAITNKPPLLREDYALADVLGAHYAGLISARDSLHVVVTADSIWAPQYSPPNVIDGDPATFWASIEGGPMPHWIEIALSKPATVSGARVACRPGFLLKDFEVHYKTDEAWEIGATVVDNTEWTIECLFLEPVRISAARLFVKREELNGENRVIADVSEFILLNEKGRPLIVPPYHLEVHSKTPEWRKAIRSDSLVLRSPVIHIEPLQAQVLATFATSVEGEEEWPFCIRNRFGKGTAYLFAIPAGGLGEDPHLWEAILRAGVGRPIVRHSGDENVLVFLHQGKRHSLLHLCDMNAGAEGRAKEIIVRVNTKLLGSVNSVQVVPEGPELATKISDVEVQVVAPLDPHVTLLLKHGR